MSDIKRVFLNVNMVNRIDGLQKVAKDAGINLSKMVPGDYLFFVNSKRDKIAALVGEQKNTAQDMMAYTRLKKGQTLDLRAITNIPRFFNGKSLNYDKALEAAITKSLAKKGLSTIESY